MVSLRRFGPLIAVMVVLLALTLSRLFDIQVREHEIWAREAVNLVRSATIEPYRRGSIHDREGRILARDQEVYELEFVWRDFRRGHPLGQVAMMRSLLLMRPVPLEEARERLHFWADDFMILSPAQIDAFGRGGEIAVGDKFVPRTPGESKRERIANARSERRNARARDLHFYIRALLGFDRRETRALSKLRGKPQWERPYIELKALAMGSRGGTQGRIEAARMSLRGRLHERLERAMEHLSLLAGLIDWSTLEGASDVIDLLEKRRRYVEDSTADELFRRAAGFGASRLDAGNLARIDLDWLRRCLYWDVTRLEKWIRDRGELWPAAVREYLAGHAIARFKLDESLSPSTRVLSSIAQAFEANGRTRAAALPRDWRRVDGLVVLDRFRARFEETGGVPEQLLLNALPFQDPALREASLEDHELLGYALAASGLPDPELAAKSLTELARLPRRTWDPPHEALVIELMLTWDRMLQSRVAKIFAEMPDAIRFDSDFVDAAVEDRPYVVRDRGARAQRIATEPRYELVHLVTRDPRRYAGFHVRDTTRRVPTAFYDEEGQFPLAGKLIGNVRSPYLVDLLKSRKYESRLHDLQSKLQLLEEDREQILDAIEQTFHAGEFTGNSGIEGYFDEELTGLNGYRESQGLQDQKEGNRAPIHEPPRDGSDLRLTIDSDLQRAAQAVLENPAPVPPGEDRPDRVWWKYPVGAIVMITADGDVLAAASTPLEHGLQPGPQQDGQRAFSFERTLRQSPFQPPGSIFKPFVAAFALEERGAAEVTAFRADCVIQAGDMHAGYGRMHCHSTGGHGHDVDLHRALVVSCNSFFAALGEQLYDGAGLREMAHTFGFNRPTGVRSMGPGRTGLFENFESHGFMLNKEFRDTDVVRQRLGNGLTNITCTPMQVARAYAGLATGELPALRLVSHIAGEQVPAVKESLPIGRAALNTVHRGLKDVVRSGSAAHKGLDAETLGFTLAAKTGSADYKANGMVPVDPDAPLAAYVFKAGVRKHTWVAGWFPADAPEAIVVCYVHDTSTTSGHSAVYVAAQFLSTPAVQEFARELGQGGAAAMIRALANLPRRVFSRRHVRWHELDWHILLIAMGLLAIGMTFIHAMDVSVSNEASGSVDFAGHRQKVLVTLPLIALGVCMRPLWIKRNAHWLYFAALTLVALVPFIGEERNNARRWIQLQFFDLQPSELAKLGLILMLAKLLHSNPLEGLGDWLKPLCAALVPMAMVAAQPDLGTALTIVPVTFGMLYLAGARMRTLIVFSLVGVFAGWGMVEAGLVKEYQLKRIETWAAALDQENLVELKDGSGFHLYHARVAAGNGGFYGRGLGEGVANETGFLPERDSDSIFAVIAEEAGFLGTSCIMVLYALMVLLLMGSASGLRDRFSRLVVGGVALYFAAHLFINVWVNIGLLPMTGLTLPLFSAGGSSLLVTFLALGIALGLASHHEASLDQDAFRAY